MKRYGVVVAGGGLVGTATALGLARAGIATALLEQRPAPAPESEWDTRIYAINPGSQAFLERLGAWQRLDAARLQAVYRMDVRGDGGGFLRLDSYEGGVERLATILESGRLQQALLDAARAEPLLDVLCPAALAGVDWQAAPVLTLDDGSELQCELLAAADGADSPLRAQAGIAAPVTPYRQLGVVANFACAKPHRGAAFQWFRGASILAWLPLPGQRLSMVWSAPEELAQELLALDGAALAERVQAAGGGLLGHLELLTPAAGFPLRLIRPEKLFRPGFVLVGDAAHGVHPLAGQGVNLGFGDAESLVDVLAARGRAACGDALLLARHARRRREPVAAMQGVTHGLYHLFAASAPLAGALRNGGMTLLNQLGPVKSQLIQHALIS